MNFIKKLSYSSIWLFISVLLLLTLSFAAISYALYQKEYSELKKTYKNNILNTNMMQTHWLKQWLKNKKQQLMHFSQGSVLAEDTFSFIQTQDEKIIQNLSKHFKQFETTTDYKDIRVLNAKGQILIRNTKILQDNSNEKAYVIEAVEKKEVIISELQFQQADSLLWWDAYIPLYLQEDKQEIIAVLAIRLYLDNFLLKTFSQNNYYQSVLVQYNDSNQKQAIIFSFIDKKIKQVSLHKDKEGFVLIDNLQGVLQPISHSWYLFSYTPLAEKFHVSFPIRIFGVIWFILIIIISIIIFLALHQQTINRNLEKKSSHQVQSITAAIPGAVYQLSFSVEGEPKLLFLSQGAKELYGLSIEQIKRFPWNIFDFIIPEDMVKFHDSLRLASSSLSDWQITFSIVTPFGETKFLQNYAIPSFQKDGSILWNGILIDISQQKEIEQALKRSEERFRDLVATVPGVIYQYFICKDGEQGFYYLSPQCEELFGDPPEKLLKNWSLERYLYAKDIPKIRKEMMALFNSQPQFWQIEGRAQAKNNKIRWFRAQSRVLRINNNEIQLYGVMIDITDYRRLENSLIRAKKLAEQASAAKSDFVSRMSHELRTPLNTILGFSQLLLTDTNNPLETSQQQSLEQVNKAGWYLLELINEVLDLSRIEAGKISFSLEPYAPEKIMQECYDMILPVANKRNITVEMTLPKANLCIMIDHLRLRQAILNLLSNAIKYNNDNGKVFLYTEQPNPQIFRIIVKDTGIGISETNLKKLFEPFNRLGQEYSSQEGTGIGLVITKRLIELMAGRLGVSSKEGVGSEFFIDIPLVNQQDFEKSLSDKTVDKQLLELPNTREYIILYIEDKIESVQLLQSLFARYPQLRLHSVQNPQLGIEIAQNIDPDIILMDMKLPKMHGYEVFQQLQSNKLTNHIPVIAISADAMPQQIQKAKELGFYHYLTKPVIIEELQKVIANILLKKS